MVESSGAPPPTGVVQGLSVSGPSSAGVSCPQARMATSAATAPPEFEADGHARRRRRGRDGRVAQDRQGVAACEGAEVAAIEAARDEAEAVRVGRDLALRDQPAPEMIGIVGEAAHIGGAHVEEMAGIVGRIGEAATEIGAPLDDRDRDSPGIAAQEMGRHQRAAGAAADDGDPESGGGSHWLLCGGRRSSRVELSVD